MASEGEEGKSEIRDPNLNEGLKEEAPLSENELLRRALEESKQREVKLEAKVSNLEEAMNRLLKMPEKKRETDSEESESEDTFEGEISVGGQKVYPIRPAEDSVDSQRKEKVGKPSKPAFVPTKFSGKYPEKAMQFLRQWERLLAAYPNWTDNERVNFFGLNLEERALAWFESIVKKKPRIKWQEIRQEFKKKYVEADDITTLESLKTRRQGPNESVADYHWAMEELCAMNNPNMSEKKKIGWFLSGLRDEFRVLLTQRNLSLDELVKNAQALEMKNPKKDAEKSKEGKEKKRSENLDSEKPKVDAIIKPSQTGKSDLEKRIADLEKMVAKLGKKQISNASNVPRQSNSQVQCYNCRQFGHYASRCPNPRTSYPIQSTPNVPVTPQVTNASTMPHASTNVIKMRTYVDDSDEDLPIRSMTDLPPLIEDPEDDSIENGDPNALDVLAPDTNPISPTISTMFEDDPDIDAQVEDFHEIKNEIDSNDVERSETNLKMQPIGVNGLIGDQVVDIIIDSGSGASFINENVLSNMDPSFIEEVATKSITFMTAGSDDMKISRKVRIRTNIGDTDRPICYFVHPDLAHSAILGNDFLRDDFVIDYRAHVIRNSDNLDIPWFYVGLIDEKKPSDLKLPEGIDLSSDDIPDDVKIMVGNSISKYPDVFATNNKAPGTTHAIEHKIELTSSIPIHQMPYRYSPQLREIIKKETDEMLKNGIIRRSNSAYASPVVLVPKPDGSHRTCIDYRKLNEVTIRDSFPLPLIDQILDAFHGAELWTLCDCASGYYQVPMREEDKPKTAFITHEGLFEFNVMPFGLSNAPSTFQRLMNSVLAELLWKNVIVYIDDIIIFSRKGENHAEILEKVFQKLRAAGIRLKASKCRFARRKIDILGFRISQDGQEVQSEKVRAVVKMRQPRSIREVQSFLGMANYYRKFIQNFAQIVRPLYDLTKKENEWNWTKEQQRAFEKVKLVLTNAPILAHPDFSKTFILETDASNFQIGAVLLQEGSDGKEHVIAYASRSLLPAEKNYSVIERETLALVWAMTKKFREYLLGAKCQVRTDHKPLTWLKKFADTSSKLMRWSLRLQEYDFDIEYKPGKNNESADALSRLELEVDETQGGGEKKIQENREEILGEDLEKIFFIQNWSDNKELARLQGQDEELEKILEKNSENLIKSEEGLWMRQWRKNLNRLTFTQVYLPKVLRAQVLERFHDDPLIGSHLGQAKTLEKIRQRFWWPTLAVDVENWIKSCLTCNTRKSPRTGPQGLLRPIPPGEAFELVAMDLVGPLPESKRGNTWLLVFSDQLSKWIEMRALPDATATRIADAYLEEVISRHGVPKKILTDQGSNFMSDVFEQVNKLLGVRHLKTSTYHPQTDFAERSNQTIINMISNYVNSNNDDWDEILPFARMAYMSSTNATIRQEPFLMLYGRLPTLPEDRVSNVENIESRVKNIDEKTYLRNLQRRLELVHSLARMDHEAVQGKNKKYYDEGRKNVEFEVGEKIYLHVPAIEKGSNKFSKKWFGPYEIVRKLNAVTYHVRAIDESGQLGQAEVVHVSRMKPYHDPKTLRRGLEEESKENTDLVESDNTYEVEKIVKHRETLDATKNKVTEYKVRWKGYRPRYDTWEPESNLDNAKEEIETYWRRIRENEKKSKKNKPAKEPKRRQPTRTVQGRTVSLVGRSVTPAEISEPFCPAQISVAFQEFPDPFPMLAESGKDYESSERAKRDKPFCAAVKGN